MTASPQPQTTIYETTIENDTLEQALERRQKLKDAANDAARKFREADGVCRVQIDELDLGIDAPARLGRFVLETKQTKETPVSFTRGGGTRVTIGLLPDE